MQSVATPELQQIDGRRWVWTPARMGGALYCVVLAAYCVVQGVPLDRLGQTGWILAGIVAVRLGRPLADHARAVLDWLPLLGALLAYDYSRGVADTLGMPVRVAELAEADRWLFGGTVPTVWLQERLYDVGTVPWWEVPVSLVYFSHFIVPWVLAAAFYLRDRERWAGYMRRIVLLSYAGLLTYVLVPAAPPWFASEEGVIREPVERIATRGWDLLGLRTAGAWLADAQADVNLVAALPSLHAAFAMMIAVTAWPLVRRRLARVALAAFPVAMGFSLVYGGEHYVTDVLVGWVYVAAACGAARLWERWRAGHRERTAAEPEPATAS
ncbi:MAG TPA: phosphatase PAP2 family protein [Pseudonocardiaceae bacterium]